MFGAVSERVLVGSFPDASSGVSPKTRPVHHPVAEPLPQQAIAADEGV